MAVALPFSLRRTQWMDAEGLFVGMDYWIGLQTWRLIHIGRGHGRDQPNTRRGPRRIGLTYIDRRQYRPFRRERQVTWVLVSR